MDKRDFELNRSIIDRGKDIQNLPEGDRSCILKNVDAAREMLKLVPLHKILVDIKIAGIIIAVTQNIKLKIPSFISLTSIAQKVSTGSLL